MAVLTHPARFKVLACGRRWGKTALGLLSVIQGQGAWRGQWPGAIQGGKIWWVAPSNVVSNEIWRDLKLACREGWADKDEVERRIELPGGGSVTVRSAVDPEALVAAGLDGLVIDEAAQINEKAWDILRPTLADRQGWCTFISTPKGFNWFYDRWEYASHDPAWQRWQRPSSDNPLMTAAELAQAKLDAPRLYGQEYEARFEQPEGAEWPPSYFPASLWFKDWPSNPKLSLIACDPSLGRGEKRKGCWAFVGYGALDSSGILYVEAWGSQDWDGGRLGEVIVEKSDLFRPTSVLYEGNGGQSFLGNLLQNLALQRNYMLPLEEIVHTAAQGEKEERIRGELTPRLRRFEFRFRDTPGTRTMVNQCREFPVGEYKDGPDMLAMLAAHTQVLLRRRQSRAPTGWRV